MKLYRNIIYYSLWKGKLTDRLHLFSQKIKEKSWQLILLPLIISLFSSAQTFAYDCSAQGESVDVNECNALIDFYNSTGGENWSDSPGNNWNVEGTTPCADWAGITCNEGGQVAAIDRKERNLIGTLPDLSALTVLDTLDLRSNQLSGPVSNVSGLTNLVYLYLSRNQFSGSIPDLSELNGLKELILDGNQLTGSIPSSLTTLTQLKWLILRSNQLTGSLPDLSTLTQLRYLYLGKNAFGGTIPSFLTKLTQLQELDLELTQLSGPIPDLSMLTELRSIDLSKNQLNGEIPSSLMALSKLQELFIGENSLTSTCDPTLVAFLESKSLEWKNQASSICSPPVIPNTPLPTIQTLTVVKKGMGIGTITSSIELNDEINCGKKECTKKYSTGSTVQLTATADKDSFFSGWEPEKCSAPFPITSDMTCTATFGKKTTAPTTPVGPTGWSVTVTITGNGTVKAQSGSISKECPSAQECLKVPSGSSVWLKAIANEGSHLSGWDCQRYGILHTEEKSSTEKFSAGKLSTVNELKNIQGAINCRTIFSNTDESSYSYHITIFPSVSKTKGNIFKCSSLNCNLQEQCTESGKCGEVGKERFFKLKANPTQDYTFSNWTCKVSNMDEDIESLTDTVEKQGLTDLSITKKDETITCKATFKEKPKLTVTVEGQGSVSATTTVVKDGVTISETKTCGPQGGLQECQQLVYDLNTVVTLTANASNGYFFQGWSDACLGTSPIVTVTMDQAKTCVAKFGIPQWTFMVYLDADNSLEEDGIKDFLEMAQVENNNQVNIVVQFDRKGSVSSEEGWSSCKRFLVKKDMRPTSANQMSDLGECNMGDPDTLKKFIDWATSNYPAQQYALVIWNHGVGWRTPTQQKEVAWDDTDDDVLFMKEVKQALNGATTKVNLIGFDACLMGMVEVAYQLKDTGASVLVGSEEVELGDGWPYDKILTDLSTSPNLTPEQLGSAIVDRYSSSSDAQTQSAIRLNKMGDLATAVSTLADTMRTSWASNYSKVQEDAQKVINEIKLSVISEKHGANWPGSHGLAIYFPLGSISEYYNENHIDFPAHTLWDEFLGDFSLKMKNSWIYPVKILSQYYSVSENVDLNVDLYDFCERLVSFAPTIQSMGSGDWDNSTTWGVWNGTTWQTGIRKPGETDKVAIQNDHHVRLSSNEIKVNSLFNQGSLLGQDGKDGSGTSLSDYQHATDGGSVVLKATALAFNAENGKIKAGRGGSDITHRSFTLQYYIEIEAKGGNGGSIDIYAPTIINEGMIGPEKKPNYVDSTDALTSDGGNGGMGSNSRDIIREVIDKKVCEDGIVSGNEIAIVDQQEADNIHNQYNEGNANGGKGGNTTVNGTMLLINKGQIASGYGGDARVWWCPWVATAGEGGQLTALSNSQLIMTGIIKGGKGRVLVEPDITLFGKNMRIEDAKEIVIFGGDGWKLSLSDLASEAISATEKITLSVGRNGVIDLRNNASTLFKAGQEVQIFADTILLDEGKVLKDIIDAPNIQTHPGKILYEVTLSGPGATTAGPGVTSLLDIKVINAGPNPDVYTLTLSDSAGWQLGSLPNTVTVEGLGMAELQVGVTLPQVIDAMDTITVTAISQNDPSVMAKTDIQVTVRPPESDVSSGSSESVPTTASTEEGMSGSEKQGITGDSIGENSTQTPPTLSQGEAIIERDVAQIRQGMEDQSGSPQSGGALSDESQENLSGVMIGQPLLGMDGTSQPLIGWNSSEMVPPVEIVQTPVCPTEGLINWTCHAQGQTLHDLMVGPWGSISNGILVGTLDNQGWVSNLTIDAQGVLRGGTVTGYILNQGTLVDITFVGMMLQGGILAGTILNESQVGGTLIDVTFSPNAHLIGGKLQGQIQGDQEAPTLLENVKILKGSTVLGVKLGSGVLLEEGVQVE